MVRGFQDYLPSSKWHLRAQDWGQAWSRLHVTRRPLVKLSCNRTPSRGLMTLQASSRRFASESFGMCRTVRHDATFCERYLQAFRARIRFCSGLTHELYCSPEHSSTEGMKISWAFGIAVFLRIVASHCLKHPPFVPHKSGRLRSARHEFLKPPDLSPSAMLLFQFFGHQLGRRLF